MVSMWAVIWIRYRSYIYIIPALLTVPVAIYGIRTYVTVDNQLWVATIYLGCMFAVVILSVPYNIFRGVQKKFAILESDDTPLNYELAFNPIGELDITDLDPLLVDGVLIPRQEVILPLEKEHDFTEVLPMIGKCRFVALRYHLTYDDRFAFEEEIVYYNGTPLRSRNAEKIHGYFVDINTAQHKNEYGPMPVFEVQYTTHGDGKWKGEFSIMDKAFAERRRIMTEREERAARVQEKARELVMMARVGGGSDVTREQQSREYLDALKEYEELNAKFVAGDVSLKAELERRYVALTTWKSWVDDNDGEASSS